MRPDLPPTTQVRVSGGPYGGLQHCVFGKQIEVVLHAGGQTLPERLHQKILDRVKVLMA